MVEAGIVCSSLWPSGLLADVWAGIRHETFSIGHLDLRKRTLINSYVPFDDAVGIKNPCGDGVYLLVREAARRLVGHRATNVIPKRGRIGPVASHRQNGVWTSYGASTADQRGVAGQPSALRAVACSAVYGVCFFSLAWRARAARKTVSAGKDGQVDFPDLSLCWDTSDGGNLSRRIRSFRRFRVCGEGPKTGECCPPPSSLRHGLPPRSSARTTT